MKFIILNWIFRIGCPIDLTRTNDNLTGPLEHPLFARCFGVIHRSISDYVTHRVDHALLYLKQPFLNHTLRSNIDIIGLFFVDVVKGKESNYSSFGRVDFISKRDDFVFGRNHCGYFLLIGKLESINAFEALFQVRLHSKWIFRLWQYLQQFVVWQKEKSFVICRQLCLIFKLLYCKKESLKLKIPRKK